MIVASLGLDEVNMGLAECFGKDHLLQLRGQISERSTLRLGVIGVIIGNDLALTSHYEMMRVEG